MIVKILSFSFLSLTFLWAEPRPYVDDSLLKELLSIHGVRWRNVLEQNGNIKSIVREKLKEIIMQPKKYYPDASDAKLASGNAIVGYGQLVSKTSSRSTQLSNEVLDFYKGNINQAFLDNNEYLRQALYSSLRFTGSIDALDLLHDALTRETRLDLKLDLLNYAKDILSESEELTVVNNTIYSNVDTLNLSPNFATRGSDDNWNDAIDKFLMSSNDIINSLPKKLQKDQLFIESLMGMKEKFEKAKEKIALNSKMINHDSNEGNDQSGQNNNTFKDNGNSSTSKSPTPNRQIAAINHQDIEHSNTSNILKILFTLIVLGSICYSFYRHKRP